MSKLIKAILFSLSALASIWLLFTNIEFTLLVYEPDFDGWTGFYYAYLIFPLIIIGLINFGAMIIGFAEKNIYKTYGILFILNLVSIYLFIDCPNLSFLNHMFNK